MLTEKAAAATEDGSSLALGEIAQREIDRRAARGSLAAFCGRMDDAYRTTAVSRLTCEHLDALASREICKLMIFMPPGAGKTYHAGERFPAYMLGRHPTAVIMSVSYAERKAQDSSWRVRELIRDRERWPWPNVEVPPESSAVSKWRTTTGGEFHAVGIGAGIAGFHPHGLIIDDPIGDPDDANSALYRERQWRWYTEVAARRLPIWGWQLIMMTRWHPDDLAGRILDVYRDWTVLTLPLYAEEHDPLGRVVGELLPDYDGSQIPDVAAGQMSSRAFSAQYQQRPTPETGTLFERSWFERRAPLPAAFVETVLVVDSAWETGVGNDYSVIARWGFDGISYRLIDVWRAKVEYPALKRAVIDAFVYDHANAVLVEDAASGKGIIQEFRASTNLPIIAVKPIGSKYSRAEAVTPLFEAGKVILPPESIAPWLDAWAEEHVEFPNGKHDDQVDTTSMALTYLSQRVTRPKPFSVRV